MPNGEGVTLLAGTKLENPWDVRAANPATLHLEQQLLADGLGNRDGIGGELANAVESACLHRSFVVRRWREIS
jgi:hypothetical protein